MSVALRYITAGGIVLAAIGNTYLLARSGHLVFAVLFGAAVPASALIEWRALHARGVESAHAADRMLVILLVAIWGLMPLAGLALGERPLFG